MVGSVMLKVLEERKFPVSELIPVASEKSAGKEIQFKGEPYKVITLEEAVAQKPDIALFSAGGETSLLWAPKFAAVGCRVVDNSSAWRMDPSKKLIVPEVNGELLTKNDFIIANPNCSTIQLVMVLDPLHIVDGRAVVRCRIFRLGKPHDLDHEAGLVDAATGKLAAVLVERDAAVFSRPLGGPGLEHKRAFLESARIHDDQPLLDVPVVVAREDRAIRGIHHERRTRKRGLERGQ